jgi:flagellar basal-body rod protein FlgF/flagellar basal-body rod protein FlgG
MPYGLYLSAEGAHAQSVRLETIAHNLANVDTIGFKRQLALFQARYAEETARGGDAPGSGTINDLGGGVEVRETRTDHSPGPIKWTGTPTDMALQSEGFFVVERDGQQMLTRAGNFRLTAEGELVTQQGWPVLSDAGSKIVINSANGPWEVTRDGIVRQRGSAQAIGIVRPQSEGDLVHVGGNLFRPLANPKPVPAAERNVAGGYLEMAGVQPTTEMVELIEASRAIEANLNMMQTQDQMLAALVNRLMRS